MNGRPHDPKCPRCAVKCPYCGETVGRTEGGLTARHHEDHDPSLGCCEGSLQNPRSTSDRRPTWRDEERVGVKWDPWSPDFDPELWRTAA